MLVRRIVRDNHHSPYLNAGAAAELEPSDSSPCTGRKLRRSPYAVDRALSECVGSYDQMSLLVFNVSERQLRFSIAWS